MIAWLAVAWAMAAPAAAQAPDAADAAVGALGACVAAAERDPEAERACVGAQALVCIDADPAQTAAGMAACYAAEAAGWDAVLNGVHGDLVAMMRAAALAADADATAPGPQEALLQQAQTAWAAFREAECALEASLWGAQEMREAAEARCRLERGAERTLELVARRRGYESP